MISLLIVSLVNCGWEDTKKATTEIRHNVSEGAKKIGRNASEMAEKGTEYVKEQSRKGTNAARRAWFDYKKGTLMTAIDKACSSPDKVQQLCEIRKEIEKREHKLHDKINAYSQEDHKEYADQIKEENSMLTELHRLKARCE